MKLPSPALKKPLTAKLLAISGCMGSLVHKSAVQTAGVQAGLGLTDFGFVIFWLDTV